MTKSENSNEICAAGRAKSQIMECGDLSPLLTAGLATPPPMSVAGRQVGSSKAVTSHRTPKKRSLLTAPFLLLIKIYQYTLSPLLHALAGPSAGCRFHPTCSCYAADALRAHGLLRGTTLAAWRLLRCNPFTPGGHDPVPPPAPALRTHCAEPVHE